MPSKKLNKCKQLVYCVLGLGKAPGRNVSAIADNRGDYAPEKSYNSGVDNYVSKKHLIIHPMPRDQKRDRVL